MDMRIADKDQVLREVIDRAMMQMNTCIPGIIDAFDSATQTASVRPAILMRTNIDGIEGMLEPPQIVQVPLVFPFASTAGFALTLPVQPGDPCLIIFSQRGIDNWHELGGVQPPEEGVASRHHDLTDAFAILAPSPIPSVLGQWQADGIELRNRARTSFIKVTDSQVEITTTDVVVNTQTATVIAEESAVVESPIINLSDGVQTLFEVVTSAFQSLFNTHTHQDPTSGSTSVPNQQMDETHMTTTVRVG